MSCIVVSDAEVTEALGVCRHCSEILMPGVNCDFRIAKARKKGRKNCVKYTCRVCNLVTTIDAVQSDPKKRPKAVHKAATEKPKIDIKLTSIDQQRIVAGIPATFRTLTAKPDPQAVLSSFFSQSTSGPSLYSLFH